MVLRLLATAELDNWTKGGSLGDIVAVVYGKTPYASKSQYMRIGKPEI